MKGGVQILTLNRPSKLNAFDQVKILHQILIILRPPIPMPYDLCYKMPVFNEVLLLKVLVLFSAFPNLLISLLTLSLSVYRYVFSNSGEYLTDTVRNPDLRMNIIEN